MKDAKTGDDLLRAPRLSQAARKAIADGTAPVFRSDPSRLLPVQCKNCKRIAYAHGLCHRCWCRRDLFNDDTTRKPVSTPQVAPYFATSVPWGSRQGSEQ